MNTEESWKQLGINNDKELLDLMQPGQPGKLHTSNPLQKIKRHLLMNMIYGCIVIGIYFWIIIRYPYWQVLLTIGITAIFSGWTVYTAYRQYRQLMPKMDRPLPLLNEMETHYENIQEWIKVQLKAAVFIYPISTVGGFMIGGMIGSGKPIEFFLSKPRVLWSLLIVTVLLVPCALFIAKWLFRISFGKHLTTLKKNIEELKEDK